MKYKVFLIMGFCMVAMLGTCLMTGCCKKPEPEPAEKAGAKLDKVIGKTEDAAKRLLDETNDKIKDAAKELENKTSKVLKDVGSTIEKTGEDMQDN